jgi:hypothetical protein
VIGRFHEDGVPARDRSLAGDSTQSIGRTRMNIVCPFCSSRHEDALEVLDADTLHDDFNCTHCGKPFVAYINDCTCCATECAFAWKTVPSPIELAALTCRACGHRNVESSGDVNSEPDAFF